MTWLALLVLAAAAVDMTAERWCKKCERYVGPLHSHSVAWYLQRPDGGWSCRWCHAPLKSNKVTCNCGLGPKRESDDE